MALHSIKLKKQDFADGYCRLMPGAVSNGKWAIRTSVIQNAALFETKAAADAFLGVDSVVDGRTGETFEGISPGGKVHPWRATKFLYDSGAATARLFQSSETGELTGIDTRFLRIFNEDNDSLTLHGSMKDGPFMLGETRETAVAVFMPFKVEEFPTRPPTTTKKKK